MVSAMTLRGPDGNGAIRVGAAGLGHTMLWTTPESLSESLPRTDATSGLSITADARIDNREDLIEALNIQAPPSQVSDSELLLRAYCLWGEDAPTRLVGDFAFAIWDSKAHQFFCARDAMGIKALYYFVSPSLFAFASEIKALCSMPEIPARLNELRVLDFLANFFDDRAITFYKDIYRLPAGSTMTVTQSNLRIARYWSLDARQELKLSSDQEYAEAFRECFAKCVRARLRSAFPIGSALSGGLDSSAVACVARRSLPASLPLHTFSLIFPSFSDKILRQIDERNYINDVLSTGGFDAHFLRADELSPLEKVQDMHRRLDEAFFAGNLYLHWAMYEEANRHGVRVFLDGLDGDTTVSHGYEYLSDLVQQFRWKRLLAETRMLAARLGVSPRQIVRDFCIKPFCPTWVYSTWRRLRGRPPDAGVLQTFMQDGFKRRLGFDKRARTLIPTKRICFSTARQKHSEMIAFPLYAHALELADKSSAAFHVEGRYPFFDRRMIELCLSLPASQKLSQGWPRLILRRAMEGILPESVRWRHSKANLSPNFYCRLLDRDRQKLEAVILSDPSELEPYVDVPSLRQAYEAYSSNPLSRHDDSVNIFSAVNLAIWLRTAGVRP
jgi:asparagine synthase (glutamine-hydrolysing)